MADPWKVMHVSAGKIEAIGKAVGPHAPGDVLRVKEREYEVAFSEGDLHAGWIYVTSRFLTRTPAAR